MRYVHVVTNICNTKYKKMHKYIPAKARHFAGCQVSGEERPDRNEKMITN